MPIKIEKCKKCQSSKIQFRDCGYSNFNPGGGKCTKCGYEVMSYVSCMPTRDELVKVWNEGQELTAEEKLRIENAELKAEIEKLKNLIQR